MVSDARSIGEITVPRSAGFASLHHADHICAVLFLFVAVHLWAKRVYGHFHSNAVARSRLGPFVFNVIDTSISILGESAILGCLTNYRLLRGNIFSWEKSDYMVRKCVFLSKAGYFSNTLVAQQHSDQSFYILCIYCRYYRHSFIRASMHWLALQHNWAA